MEIDNIAYYEEGIVTYDNNQNKWVSIDEYGGLSLYERFRDVDDYYAIFIRNGMLEFYEQEDGQESKIALLDQMDDGILYEEGMPSRYSVFVFASAYDLQWAKNELNEYIKNKIEAGSIKKLSMYPDFGNECFWYEDGTLFDMAKFNLQERVPHLYKSLQEWIQEFQKHQSIENFNWNSFDNIGRQIHQQLQFLVAEEYYIEYTISYEEKEARKNITSLQLYL